MKKLFVLFAVLVSLISCGSTPTPLATSQPSGQVQASSPAYLTCQGSKLSTATAQTQPTTPIDPPKPSTGGGC